MRGDLDVIAAMLAPDVKWHGGDPKAVGSCQNRTEALEFIQRAVKNRGVGDLVDVIGRGEKVVVVLQPPADPEAPVRLVANLTTFRNGKVVEMVAYADPDEALAAAGL